MLRFSIIFTLLMLVSYLGIAQKADESNLTAVSPNAIYAPEATTCIKLLSYLHYKKLSFGDSLSHIAFEGYLEELDPAKLYFLKREKERYATRYAMYFDDMIEMGDLMPVYEMFNHFREKAIVRFEWIMDYLEEEPDLNQEDYYDTRYSKRQWATNEKALDAYWDQLLRHNIISLRLTGKSWDETQEIVIKRYTRMKRNVLQTNSQDVFELFMRTVTAAYDPHTTYFSPITAENFNIEMSHSLEGIGARLTVDVEYTVINDLIAGGPAYKEGSLQKDDKIVGIAQGEEGAFVDVIGWRLDDVVQLVRGEKGTTVRLQVVGAGDDLANYREVHLVREKITIEDALATKEVLKIERDDQEYTLGVITVPSFYLDFEAVRRNEEYKSVSRDVRKLVEELQQENINGLLLDMRQNGGGALSEAVELTGLFIEKGGVVQVKSSNNKLEVIRDQHDEIVYDGPLMVLVNRFSASATEIFAGAIQDYNRGLVIGEPTFGKGTVQQVIPLENVMPPEMTTNAKVGQVKLTTAKFYRVNGKSTQKKGIIPDLALPSNFEEKNEYREAGKPGALVWDELKNKAWVRKSNSVNVRTLAKLKQRLQTGLNDEQWAEFMSKKAENNGKRNYKRLLSLDKRRIELEEQTAKTPAPETIEEDKLSKDIHLKESLLLLADLVSLNKDDK